jgi:tryptophan 7-halogenase
MSRKVERVVVVGRDAAGWLSAFALQRQLGRSGLAVQMVELPSQLSPVDVYAAIPTLQNLHRLLGLEDDSVVGVCSGVYVLGQRFANWSKARPPFMHAYDTHGIALEHVDFLQYWVKARGEGMNVDLEDFSLGAAAAKQNRYVLGNESTEAFSNAAHGYHLDARTYVRVLKQCALKSGARHIAAGSIASVNRVGARIQSVVLADGQVIEGDLFIDASGAEAALIGQMPGAAFEPWNRWLGANRIMAASGKRLEPLPGFSQISAFRTGWLGLYPLQDRTAMSAVYDATNISDSEMAQSMAVLSGLRIEGNVVASEFRAGARACPWSGNCVAIGEAAVTLEPLDAVQLQLIQIGLSHLIALFPVDADAMLETDLYNAGISAYARNIRDFQIAHYKLNQRIDDPVWDRAREMKVPDELQYKLDLFGRRGRVALYENETFQAENWTSIFVGHGLVPRSYDPLADALPGQEQIQEFQRMLRFISAEVQAMPSLEAHLEFHAPRGGS